jgi:hypothetical protein
MARRAARPASIREVLVETARRIAPWPSAERTGRTALDEAIAGENRPIRRSGDRRTAP